MSNDSNINRAPNEDPIIPPPPPGNPPPPGIAGADTFPHHPSVQAVLQYFAYDHLPEELATVSKPFAALAFDLAERCQSSPELTVALRKLLEAKDAAVRASKPGNAGETVLAVYKALQG
jgi:hypothetical protein